MRKIKFSANEFYHVYNRGAEHRNIVLDKLDSDRFVQSMQEFNVLEPIGSIYENSFIDSSVKTKRESKKLVNIIAYCLNTNHFHFILEPLIDDGISKFIKRLAGGYSWYFNNKHKRNGVLFQGPFKAIHINSNDYLLHLSAYVNLNFKVHQLGDSVAKLVRSSWEEYLKPNQEAICKKEIISDQFNTPTEYKRFALEALPNILERKKQEKEIATLLFE